MLYLRLAIPTYPNKWYPPNHDVLPICQFLLNTSSVEVNDELNCPYNVYGARILYYMKKILLCFVQESKSYEFEIMWGRVNENNVFIQQ